MLHQSCGIKVQIFWEGYQNLKKILILMLLSNLKKMEDFFQILWPCHNIWTLLYCLTFMHVITCFHMMNIYIIIVHNSVSWMLGFKLLLFSHIFVRAKLQYFYSLLFVTFYTFALLAYFSCFYDFLFDYFCNFLDIARTYLQLPLRQWGAGNVYLLVLPSWKVNIAENPIAVMGL